MFTLLGAKVMLPYLSVAVVHWYLAAHWSKWPRCRASANLAFEVGVGLRACCTTA